MPHMVIFRTGEGKPGQHMTEGLDDAVRFVEHLRNSEGVTDAKVYRMTEIPIEFKVLYKVEVADGDAPAASGSAPSTSAGPSPTPSTTVSAPEASTAQAPRAVADEPPVRAGLADPQQAGGRFGLFSRT